MRIAAVAVVLAAAVSWDGLNTVPYAKPITGPDAEPGAVKYEVPVAQAFRPASPPYLILDLRTNRLVASSQPDSLDAPIAPGSVMKIATLVAALESGVITPRTTMRCTRDVSIAGHRLPCSHPDLHRPLTPAEALGHSCNAYFSTVASRLSRAAFDRALATLGLPPAAPGVPLPLEALGIDGVKATPRALLAAVARLAREPSDLGVARATLDTVRDGLRLAAQDGTAAAFRAGGVDALAKTGTAPGAGGAYRGLVVAVAPARDPAVGIALIAPGGAGVDAAALAAPLLHDALSHPPSRAAAPGPAPASPGATDAPVVRVGFARNGGYSIATLPLEKYVARVLEGEALRGSPPAALEALAITIRTYALANLGRHRADGFDLCDLTHCQVVRTATPITEAAAAATAGRVLLYRGVPAQVFYTASCGGRSERPSAVWPGADDPPFLVARDDPAADRTPWSSELSADALGRALRGAGFRGRLRDMRIASRNESGRVAALRLSGLVPDHISGQDLRAAVGRSLGWQHVKSTAFDLDRTSTGFKFTGRGSGHGVGFCVIGSAAIAARGRTAGEILATYFPGLAVSVPSGGSRAPVKTNAPVAPPAPVAPVAPPAPPAPVSDVLVSLPAGDEGERESMTALATRARDDLVRRLGTPKPARLVLRFHPTVESYQRATGQPWFTAAATVGNEIHFGPLPVLRERGVLERAIRHEIVHQVTTEALASRPLWVQEGVAVYFAGERPVPEAAPGARPLDTRRVSCPADAELRRPASPGALSNAYARAGACVERQITAGKKWTEVK